MSLDGRNNMEIYKNKGLTGLQNLGNTCFLNSTMQCLSHTYEFNNFLDKGEFKSYLNKQADSILLLEWNKLRELMWSENCQISPAGFIQAVQKIANIKDKDLFTGWAQNDLPEFLLFIVDCFHNALSREVDMTIRGTVQNDKDKVAKVCYEMMKNMYKKEYSEVLRCFYGIHVSKIVDHDNNELSLTPEPYFMIDLPLPSTENKNIDLYDCFNLYTGSELLQESTDNAWFNDKTGKKQDVKKNIVFWNLPDILVIDFRRFNNRQIKDQRFISIPLIDIDLRKYVDGYNKDSYVYDLYGVCNHSGGTNGGHYTAHVKNANGKWYVFNDMEVTEIPENRVISSQAYCLFLRKKN